MANTRSRSKKNRVRSLYVVYEAGDGRTNIYGSRTDVPIMWGTFVTWAWQIKRCGIPAMAAKQLKPSSPDFETGIQYNLH